MLNAAFRTWATDSKSGFVLAPRRVLRGRRLLPGGLPLLPDVHHRCCEGEGLLGARGRDTVRRSPRRRVVPRRPLGVRLAGGDRRLPGGARRSSAASAIPTGRRFAPRDRSRSRGATCHMTGWRRALVRELLRDDAVAQVADSPARALALPRAQAHRAHAPRGARRAPATQAPAARPARLRPRAVLSRPDAASGRSPRGHPLARDIARLPLLSKDDVRKHLFFDLFATTTTSVRCCRVATSGLDRRAVRDVRRSLPARDALRDDAARDGMDRLALRRPAGAALAPDARHVATQARSRADRRVVHAPACSSRPSSCRDDNAREYVAKIRKHRPFLLDGYAESFNFLAALSASAGG